jgi:hypothetical protein
MTDYPYECFQMWITSALADDIKKQIGNGNEIVKGWLMFFGVEVFLKKLILYWFYGVIPKLRHVPCKKLKTYDSL